MDFLKKFYESLYPNFTYLLDKSVGNNATLLDVGCGYPSPIKSFSQRLTAHGVDLHKPSLEKSQTEGIHQAVFHVNALKLLDHFQPKSYDCVIALDLIEHLTKPEGIQFINSLETIAKKRVIIFTPNGFVPQPPAPENPLQEHVSGWTVQEMNNKGYRVIGVNGLKYLRGQYAYIKFRPVYFWKIMSDLTQFYTQFHPQLAFQMLCIKDLTTTA